MNVPTTSQTPAHTSPLQTFDLEDLRERLQLVPPARIIAAVEDSGSILTLGDLKQYAKYMADEFRSSASRAAWESASWYQGLIEHCTPEQGVLVRQLTIEICEERALLIGYTNRMIQPVVAKRIDNFCKLIFAFVVVIALGLLLTPGDDLPDDGMDAPAQTILKQHVSEPISGRVTPREVPR